MSRINFLIKSFFVSFVFLVTSSLEAQTFVQGWTTGNTGADGRWCYPSVREACTVGGNGQLSAAQNTVTGYTCKQTNNGYTYYNAINLCYYYVQVQSSLTLIGPSETRPTGTGGIFEIALSARVVDGTNPKSGVPLVFSVDVTPKSGGHDHNDASRPKGTLSTTQGITDANGEVKVTFKPPQVAGIHTVTATCATCSNSPTTKEIQVKVPGLVEMQPDAGRPASFTLVGSTASHLSNHWFTPNSIGTLGKVADAMFKTGWGAVGVNDGSLIWGGLFDIKSGWTPSHAEHRTGEEVDISVTNPRLATTEQKKKTYTELCKKNNSNFAIQTLWHQDDGYPEHFHIYLDGSGLDKEAKGRPCCTRYKDSRPKLKNGIPVLDKNGQPIMETVALCEETNPR